MSKFLETNENRLSEMRELEFQLKNEVNKSTVMIAQNEGSMNEARRKLDSLLQSVNSTPSHQNEEIQTKLNEIQNLEETIAVQKETLRKLRFDIERIYSDLQQPSHEFRLHAVFMHEGLANFGHYWLYLFDFDQNRWLQFNDSIVKEVTAEQVFSDTTGSSANVTGLAYVNYLQRGKLFIYLYFSLESHSSR